MFTSLENFLSNLSFLTLFLSMLIFWVEISNMTFIAPAISQVKSQQSPLCLPGGIGGYPEGDNRRDRTPLNNLTQSISSNIGTSLVESSVVTLNVNQSKNQNIGQIGVIIANLSIFILLILRWKESGHFPLSNLYESLMFLSWTLCSIHLFLTGGFTFRDNVNLSSSRLVNSKAFTKDLFMSKLIGSITTPSALFTNAFATFSLPKEMQEASPLVPALQSNWLMMHVTVMILSYGALICGSLLAIAFLVITGITKETPTNSNKQKEMIKNREKLALTFDNLSYRILGIGFPLLTIGILSGAVWANEAWGSYWSWDPKETWALLTWLVFAIYLHTRLNKGWQGQKPALIASLGFVSVWVCYLGVNLLGEGLHSYGWLS